MKTKQELLDDCIRIKEKGGSYRSLLTYLHNNSEEDELIQATITAIRELEENGHLKIPMHQEEKRPISMVNLVMGFIFLFMGIGLMFFLRGEGFFSNIALLLIGIGISALLGDFKG